MADVQGNPTPEDVQTYTNESNANATARLGDTPIKITPSMIGGATDEELNTLHTNLQGGSNKDTQVAQMVADEVNKRQTPAEPPTVTKLIGPEPEQQGPTESLFPQPASPPAAVPDKPIQAPVNSFVLSEITGTPPADPSLTHSTIGDNDKLKQVADSADVAKGHLLDDTKPLPERIIAAKEAATKPPEPHTLGEIYVAQQFAELPPAPAKQLADGTDVNTRSEEAQELDATIASGGKPTSWQDFMSQQRASIPDPLDLLTYIGSGGTELTFKNDLSDLSKSIKTFLKPHLDAWSKQWGDTVAEGQLQEEQAAQYAKDNNVPLGTAYNAVRSAHTDQDVQEFKFDKGLNFNNFKELMQFVNPVPYDDSAEPDYWQALKNIVSGNGLGDDFKATMVDRYGPEWGLRWMSWNAATLGTVAATYAAAELYPPLAAEMTSGAGASRAAAWKALITRSLVTGVSGAGVQDLMNKVSGDNDNFVNDFLGWTTGNIVGEKALGLAGKGIAWGAKKLGFVADATQKIADAYNLKVFSADVAANIRDENGYKTPQAKLIAWAAIHNYSKDYMKLSEEITAAISAGNDVPKGIESEQALLRNKIAALTGTPADRLPLDIALGSRIYKQNTLENIGRAPEFLQAEKDLQDHTPVFEQSQKDLLAAEQRLAAAQKRWSGPLKTEAGQQARDTRLAKMQQELDDATAARDTAGSLTNDLQAKVKEGKGLYLTTNNPMLDQLITGQAYGFRTMGMITNAQEANKNLFTTYLMESGIQWRQWSATSGTTQNKWNPFKYTGWARSHSKIEVPLLDELGDIQEPDTKIFGAVVKDFGDAVRQSIKTGQVFSKMLGNINKGIDKDSLRLINRVMMEGAEKGKVFSPEELIGRGLSNKEMDSYYAKRQLMDFAHMVNDNSKVAEFKRKNMMMYNGTPVNVKREVDSVLTADRLKEGYVRIIEASDTGSRKPIDMLVKSAELKDPESVLKYIPGYVPIVYKNANYHASILDMKNGTIKRVASFKNLVDAQDHAKMLQAKLPEGQMAMYNNWNSVTGHGAVGFTRDGMRMFQLGSDEAMSSIKAALEHAGIDESRVRVILDRMDLTDLRRNIFGARGEERLQTTGGKPAPMETTDDAIAEYLQATAHQNGVGQWRDYAINAFKDNFPAALFDNTQPWYSKAFVRSQGSVPKELTIELHQAQDMHEWLLRAITGKTDFEKNFDNWLKYTQFQFLGDGTEEVGPIRRALSKVFDNVPAMKTIENYSRGLAVTAKLLLGNPGQFIIQGSQMAVTAGAERKFAMQGGQDMLKVFGAYMAEQGGARPNAEGRQLLYFLRSTGFINLIDNSDLMDIMSGPNKNWATYGKLMGGAPFALGEASNKLLAALAVRRDFIDKMTKGTLMGLDKVTKFDGAIDSPEFNRLVINKAKTLALDMGKAGQLEMFQGIGSLMFQFWQVGLKFGHIFETDELSGGEKLGAAAVLTGLFGVAGMPYLGDFFNLADSVIDEAESMSTGTHPPSKMEFFQNIGYKMRDDIFELAQLAPQWVRDSMGVEQKTWNRLISKGAISAMTDGEIDLANRVGMGSFFSSMTEGKDVGDTILAFSVLRDLATATHNIGIVTAFNPVTYLHVLYEMNRTNASFQDVWREITGPDSGYIPEAIAGTRTPANAAIQSANDLGRVFSYLGYMTRAYQNYNKEAFDPHFKQADPDQSNHFTTSSNKDVPVVVTKSRLAQYLMGITPGPVVTENDARTELTKYNDAMDKYEEDQVKRFNRSTEAGKPAIVAETLNELNSLPQTMAQRNVNTFETRKKIDQVLMKFYNETLYAKSPQPAAAGRM